MGNLEYRPEPFLYYDGEGIARHLEKMAARGWRLEKAGPFFWRYRRAEPAGVHYAVTYFPEASEYNPYPTDSQEEFYDYCREAGWNLVTEWDRMQVFPTERAHPIPIETDEAARVRVIHRAMLRRFLPASLLSLGLEGLIAVLSIAAILQNPVANLCRPAGLLLTLAWVLVGLSTFLNLAGYLVWYLRARKAAEAEERPAEEAGWFRALTIAVAALGLMAVLAALGTAVSAGTPWLGVYAVLMSAVCIGLVAAVRAFMRRRGVERGENRKLTLAVAAALLLVINIIPRAVIGGQPAELHIVDRAALPLVLADLQQGEPGAFTYSWETSRSPLVTYGAGWQRGVTVGGPVQLEYQVVEVHLPALFDLCRNSYLSRYDNRYSAITELHFRPLTDPAWGADEVWQVWDNEGPWPYYLACKNGRIVWLMADDFLTPEQTDIATEHLFGGTI